MPRRTMGEWVQLLCDLALLNLLWLICCLPVVTIGAATAALHSVVRKMAACEYYTVWRGFWKGFRENWKQGTAVMLILGAVLLISLGDIAIGLHRPGMTGIACQFVGVLGMIAAVLTLSMAFPVLTRYRLGLGAVLKNALLLSFANLHIVAAGLAAAALFPVLGWLSVNLMIIAVPGWVMLGVSLPVLVQQLLMRKVYARLESGQ
ncbi:MAG: YesL family protein [Eubacteriales bacterium]|nr:YesL family protein [Eubacteriales bacterium]